MRDDFIRPFQLDKAGLRGRLVRLGGTVNEILDRHRYPPPVSGMLGQAVALSAILAGALKFDGVFTLQTKGNGPVGTLVADFASPGKMRGYAQYDKTRIAELMEKDAASRVTVPQVLGAGYVAFTVDQGEDMERYQGIVELQGSSLAECAHQYFRESEQIQTAIRVACQQVGDDDGKPIWRAGAIMIQRLPIGDPAMLARGAEPEGDDIAEDDWRRAVALMASVKDSELTAEDLTADQLLFRLFHEEEVRAFDPTTLEFGCRCSADRAEGVLGSLAESELEELAVDGKLSMTCEFCNSSYVYDLTQFNN
jgi:molecular chaperone Hsp33